MAIQTFRGLARAIHAVKLQGVSDTEPRPEIELMSEQYGNCIKIRIGEGSITVDAPTLLKAITMLNRD